MSLDRLSLNALRAFEATARLRSFSAAAEELSVTHGAVSRHIRMLEDATGLPLLTRTAHGTEPTAEGQRLAEGLSRGFQLIQSSVALLALFFFGGPVLQSFTAAMIWGIFVGTYSSVFIAAPILIYFKLRSESMAQPAAAKA